jgi:cystathionine beta-lyase
VPPRQIRILPRVLHGVELAIEVFTPPACGVVIPTPAYPPFFETVRAAGRRVVEVPMRPATAGLALDLAGIDDALAAGARAVILCNPQNPTGRSFSREELAALAEIVEAHGARVITDEVHAPLTYSGVCHVPYATISEAAARHGLTITSASKGWNVPGLSCAQIIFTNEDDLRVWDRVSRLRTGGASVLGIVANRVAYEAGETWLREAMTYLERNRALAVDLFSRELPQVRFQIPDATYLLWLDCRALGVDNPTSFFLHQAKVALTDGASFGAPGAGFVRFNFGTSRTILTSIFERMAEATRALPTASQESPARPG